MNLGQWGEEQACRYLKGKGYRILERNFRCRTGELDIVAEKNAVLCFVEVKSRCGTAQGWPAEAITRQKRRRITWAASFYLQMHGRKGCSELRMDVIEVLKYQTKTYIRHIENAF